MDFLGGLTAPTDKRISWHQREFPRLHPVLLSSPSTGVPLRRAGSQHHSNGRDGTSRSPRPFPCTRGEHLPPQHIPTSYIFQNTFYFSSILTLQKKKVTLKKKQTKKTQNTIKHSGLIETEKNKAACICVLTCLLAPSVSTSFLHAELQRDQWREKAARPNLKSNWLIN